MKPEMLRWKKPQRETRAEDTYSNLIHYSEANKGGHFAALAAREDREPSGFGSLRCARDCRQWRATDPPPLSRFRSGRAG